MKYNFDVFPDRRPTESWKWNAYSPEILPMFVADMDFVSPQAVVRALRERSEHGIFGYPGEIKGIREAIVAWLSDRHNWNIQADDLILYTRGGNRAEP